MPTEHEDAVDDPERVPSSHVRTCEEHVDPHMTDDAAYAVTELPCATAVPHGLVQSAGVAVGCGVGWGEGSGVGGGVGGASVGRTGGPSAG